MTGFRQTGSVDAYAQAGAARHLSERDLARRWGLSIRTLQRWRKAKTGPAFLRLGSRIAYRLSDVESFEASHVNEGRS